MEERSEEAELTAELASCMLGHYKYCAAGVLLGLPLSIHKKSYWPVVFASAAGTAMDYKEGLENCKRQREALKACIARKNGKGAAKVQQAAPAGSFEDCMQSPPQETWQPDGQQGWPQQGWEPDHFDGGGSDQATDGRKR